MEMKIRVQSTYICSSFEIFDLVFNLSWAAFKKKNTINWVLLFTFAYFNQKEYSILFQKVHEIRHKWEK